MSRRLSVFIAALVGAALAAGGALTGLEPFKSAQAVSPPAGSLEHEQEDALREILRESEPGARVTMKEGGGFSVVGKLNAEAAAEATRAEDLAEAGPYTLRCDGGAEALRCAPVPDAEVVPALRRGDQALYGRTVHFGIPWAAIENRIPLLASDDLVCEGPASDGTMLCARAEDAKPTMPAGETTFVSYVPLRVTFVGERMIGQELGRLTVPLAREPD